MSRKKYLIILASSVVLLIGVILLFIFLPKPKEEVVEKKSDDYLANAEIFNFNLSEDGKEYYITGLKVKHQNDNTIVIPESIDSIPVTRVIGDQESFYSWRYIKELKISKNVAYIGCDSSDPGALKGGTYGSAIFIVEGANITNFEVSKENATYSSSNGILFNKDQTVLIRYPNAKTGDAANLVYNVPSTVEIIYDDAFYKNPMLKEITIGENVKTIGDKAFYKCKNLRTVHFNDKLISIGASSFFECDITRIEFPESLITIGIRSFAYNAELEYVYIPTSVKEIGLNVFSNDFKIIIYTEEENIDYLKTFESLKGIEIVSKTL